MLIRIKKMQFLVGICLILQIILSSLFLPFHFIAMFLSIVIIIWQRRFCVLQIRYLLYSYLYIYRLFVMLVLTYSFFEMLYLFLTLYVGLILILLSLKTFL